MDVISVVSRLHNLTSPLGLESEPVAIVVAAPLPPLLWGGEQVKVRVCENIPAESRSNKASKPSAPLTNKPRAHAIAWIARGGGRD